MGEIAEPVSDVKRMRLRYPGTCSKCGTALSAGATADYDRATKTVACITCPTVATDPVDDDPSATPPTAAPAVTPSSNLAPPSLEVVDGRAGGSAAREFARRHDARQQRVQAAHPTIGRFLLAVFDDPQSTRAWSSGAVGEETLGNTLAGIAGPSLRVLHDRRIPRTSANIDHLVISSAGVFVVDAKRYRDVRPERRVEGGLFTSRREVLYVGGRDRTALVDGVHKQLDLVRGALADQPNVTIRGVLCFVGADWPLLGGSFAVRDIAVLWPRKLAQVLTEPGPLDPDRIADLQWRLHQAFPRQRAPVPPQ